ncbi:hypothetical protein [Roseovarius aquimarinus]|uniref:Flagellar FliJ protein n=1 Tax=Roseovarius aquimarinus TaxID=1229156 RepID=A0ABW7I5C3_9RHOB
MSARRAHLLSLMELRARSELGRTGAALGDLRQRELQQFDLMDRLGRMLELSAQHGAEPMSPGALASAHYLGHTLSRELSATQERMRRTREEREALEHELARQHQRARVLGDHAGTARLAIRREAEEAEEAAMIRRPA